MNPNLLARALPAALFAASLAPLAAPPAAAQAGAPYYPDRWEWERRAPAAVGMDAARLEAAVAFAEANESSAPRDLLEAHWRGFAREPLGEPIGPLAPRGPATGVVVKDGFIVAEWGDPSRVDMTFSVTKSFLSTVVGLAWADGRIRDVADPVGPYLPPVVLPPGDGEPGAGSVQALGPRAPVRLFESEHNRRVAWDHLLRQTSDWEGTLWGKPEWADRPAPDPSTWRTRPRAEPGTDYEYNDVRVNVLALAATLVWRRPLSEVLRERIMMPIGASSSWAWHGYENSWIDLDGLRVQAVSGGGHWGGGMFISAYDQARFGLLTTRRFVWNGEPILPEAWWRMATTPTAAQPGYGHMNFFLNAGRERYPAAPESAFAHLGAGTNLVYCDPENDLVIVARWIDGRAAAGLVERVLAALNGRAASGTPPE